MNNDLIKIDGSIGEGGGQILRTATALAAVTKKPCHVFNVRKGRPKPGLATQHLLGIQALAQLCRGRLEGDHLGSEEIKFWPGETYRDRVSVNIPSRKHNFGLADFNSTGTFCLGVYENYF